MYVLCVCVEALTNIERINCWESMDISPKLVEWLKSGPFQMSITINGFSCERCVMRVERQTKNTLAYGREKKTQSKTQRNGFKQNRLKYLLLICMECYVVVDINGKPVPSMPNTWLNEWRRNKRIRRNNQHRILCFTFMVITSMDVLQSSKREKKAFLSISLRLEARHSMYICCAIGRIKS